jgi:hypothetical protein
MQADMLHNLESDVLCFACSLVIRDFDYALYTDIVCNKLEEEHYYGIFSGED